MFDKAIKGVNCDVSECKYHDGVEAVLPVPSALKAKKQ